MKLVLSFVCWLVLLETVLGKIFFEEQFDDDLWSSRWITSTRNGTKFGTFNTTTGKFYGDSKNKGLKTIKDAKTKFYAISRRFPGFINENKTLVLQYSVKYEQDIGEEDCAGSYIKLFNCSFQPSDLYGGTPYLLAFGPDICGNGTKRVSININYRNKVHSINRRIPWKSDIYTHIYTLIVKPDQTFLVLIDSVMVHNGNFLDNDWTIIPKKIKNPNATKPSDWDDRQKIPDPNDTKPEDWDQPLYIHDPDATKPPDWDMATPWTPPYIKNPRHKGKWKPRQIDNPAYNGTWRHPEIDNPEYLYPDKKIYRFSQICGIGFELWQEKSGTIFDNVLLTDSVEVAAAKRKDVLNIMKAEKNMKKLQDEEMAKRRELEEEEEESGELDEEEEEVSSRKLYEEETRRKKLAGERKEYHGHEGRESKEQELQEKLMATIYIATTLSVLVITIGIVSTYFIFRYRTKYLLSRKEMNDFLRGNSELENHKADAINVEGSGNADKQPYDKSKYEIAHSSFQIDLSRFLGSGEFGIVTRGSIKRGGSEVEVAVKMLQDRATSGGQSHGNYLALKGLISEIKILSYVGDHENILKLEGAHTAKLRMGKVLVFLELCELGSLEKYLRNYKPIRAGPNILENETIEMEIRKQTIPHELLQDFQRWAVEIASAMEYLSSKKIVHADLATRNVLLNSQKVAKIADFGLSRRLYNYCEYMKSEAEPLPWRWMSPESLRKMVFNENTDVWAFGVTLWEIFTLADEPYPGLSWDVNFATFLERGLRLPEPNHNQEDYYSIMNQCWDIDLDRRPTFLELKSILSAKISNAAVTT